MKTLHNLRGKIRMGYLVYGEIVELEGHGISLGWRIEGHFFLKPTMPLPKKELSIDMACLKPGVFRTVVPIQRSECFWCCNTQRSKRGFLSSVN